jgi:riboflavin kinase/FMN adenylyltransferase
MKILHRASDLAPSGRKVCVAIGVFDGVHLGHQQVIRQTISDAQQYEALAVAVTFDKHPNVVVAPTRVPPLIYSLPQKVRAIESLGVDATWMIHFDEAFSGQTGEEFVRALARDFGHLRSVCVGSEFTFGHKRSGDVSLLRKLGEQLHFTVHGLAAIALGGRTVSSTRIRDAIRQGRLDDASQMLGRNYALAGPVVKGDQLGRKLGFPTANVDAAGLALPPNGVYVAHAVTGGRTLRAAVNIGLRPTVQGAPTAPRVEAHLLDFEGDLYGQELELAFVRKLRDERKLESLEALREQIQRDVAEARRQFDAES